MKLRINIVDAFTDVLFKGNSAAVIMLSDWLSESLMLSIAQENNLSETAFVKPIVDQKFEIRCFSPITEIDFCGHATLAAAFVIFSDHPKFGKITLVTQSVGELEVAKPADGFFRMSFPTLMPKLVDEIPAALLAGLSIPPHEVLLSQQAYFVVYPDEQDVMSVVQNLQELKKLAPYDVVVTAKSQQYDFISRYFWPANGGDEDPVTGSIHAGLAPYWASKLGYKQLRAFQASSRGGALSCEVTDERVFISGQAVQYLEGYITV